VGTLEVEGHALALNGLKSGVEIQVGFLHLAASD
jgi:hypothetical protein